VTGAVDTRPGGGSPSGLAFVGLHANGYSLARRVLLGAAATRQNRSRPAGLGPAPWGRACCGSTQPIICVVPQSGTCSIRGQTTSERRLLTLVSHGWRHPRKEFWRIIRRRRGKDRAGAGPGYRSSTRSRRQGTIVDERRSEGTLTNCGLLSAVTERPPQPSVVGPRRSRRVPPGTRGARDRERRVPPGLEIGQTLGRMGEGRPDRCRSPDVADLSVPARLGSISCGGIRCARS